MANTGIRYIKFVDEESRLRYLIKKYKEHDRKRNRYIAHVENLFEQQKEKSKRLQALTEREHEEMDELMDAYDGAKPLIADMKHRAYVFELLKRSNESSKNKRKADKLEEEANNLRQENKDLKERIEALETIIKNQHNGKLRDDKK